MVEYALIVALVVIASMGAVSAAQDSGKSQLAGSDDRISPDDESYYAGAVSTTSVPSSTSTTSGEDVDVYLASSPLVTITDDGPRWQVTITFTLLDDDDRGVIGATMNGTWTDVGQGSTPVGTCVTSTSAGRCTVQYTRIKDASNQVSYGLQSISGTNFQWAPRAAGEGTVNVVCGSPTC